jgi:chemosensory pili system protein ChpE
MSLQLFGSLAQSSVFHSAAIALPNGERQQTMSWALPRNCECVNVRCRYPYYQGNPMLAAFLTGFFIALAFAAPPGPVLMETIRLGIRAGFRPALLVQLGSIGGDSVWCIAAIVGLAPLLQSAWLRIPWTILGAGILGYLGARAVWDGLHTSAALPSATRFNQPSAFRTGLIISLGNPMALGYWFAVAGAMISNPVLLTPSAALYACFAAGFVLAMAGWAVLMALLAGWGRRIPGLWFFRIIHLACGGFLLFFGAQMVIALILPSSFPH